MTNAVTLSSQYTLLPGASGYSTVETVNNHSYGATVFDPASVLAATLNIPFGAVIDTGTGRYGAAIHPTLKKPKVSCTLF